MARAYDPKLGQRSLFDALVEAAETHGLNKEILEDQDRKPLSYRDMIRACFALGRKIAAMTKPGEHVALLLPTSAGGAVTFFALHAIGRVPVMLNFTSGTRNLKAALVLTEARLVLTSRRFLAQARLEELAADLETAARVVYLKTCGPRSAWPTSSTPPRLARPPALFRKATRPTDPGVILFTSGSFASPRGVVLTQANVVSNAEQTAAVIDIDPAWTLFNPLPIFHALGLVATVLPLLRGVKTFLYPSPLHTKMVVDLVRDCKADVLVSTDTFLGQYARAADPGDLSGPDLRVLRRGEGARAHPRPDGREVRAGEAGGGLWRHRGQPGDHGQSLDDNRIHTVGRLLPGIEVRLQPVDGIPEGGRLFVRGPNVMLGYLDASGLEPPPEGWHDTGDVVALEPDGYLRLLGRAKRFAKIGGEMISLQAVEDMAASLWPDCWRAVVSAPDRKKGERLVLVTDAGHASAQALLAHAEAIGAPLIAVPRKVVKVGEPLPARHRQDRLRRRAADRGRRKLIKRGY
ncbi:MAG: AMP-binding protein [Caulobacteraceae bacterium]